MSLSAFCIEKTNGLSQRLLTMGKIILLTLLSAHLQNKKNIYIQEINTRLKKSSTLWYFWCIFNENGTVWFNCLIACKNTCRYFTKLVPVLQTKPLLILSVCTNMYHTCIRIREKKIGSRECLLYWEN